MNKKLSFTNEEKVKKVILHIVRFPLNVRKIAIPQAEENLWILKSSSSRSQMK